MKRFILLLAAFLILVGSLGLKTKAECDNDMELTDSARMECYKYAAITAAYIPDENASRKICEEIWTTYGENVDEKTGSDIREKAELVSNSCYYSIATILLDEDICYEIQSYSNIDTDLSGDQVTRDLCFNKVDRLNKLAPSSYYSTGRDNICSIVFILPVLLLAILKKS